MTHTTTRLAVPACLLASLAGCASSGLFGTSAQPTTATTANTNAGTPTGNPNNTPGMTLPEAAMTANATPNAPGTETADAPDDVPATLNISRASFADEGADFDPCVSPDGKRLFFSSTQHRKTSDLYVKLADSRVITQLTTDPADDAMPAISPDGSKIAFASNRNGQWDIFVMPATGGKAVRMTDDAADEISPSWSPDGSQLVYSRVGSSSGRWEMWVASVSNPSTPNFIGYGLFPRWCPVAATGEDGADRILFQQPRERGSRTFGVWTIDLSSGKATNTTEIVASPTAACINPSWSPDGQWIVFAEVPAAQTTDPRAAHNARASTGSLWMISTQGEGRVRLTAGQGVNLSPIWGPGERLFFVSDRTGHDNVWSMDMSPAVASAQATLGNRERFTTAEEK